MTTRAVQVATVQEIEEQGWSLNPGRYVGVSRDAVEEFDFAERLTELAEELQCLNRESVNLQRVICSRLEDLLLGAL